MPNKPTQINTDKQQEDENLAHSLAAYLYWNSTPETTPALWQDVEILIRHLKRDVWSLDDEQLDFSKRALGIYRAKYVIEKLPRETIEELLQDFSESNENDEDDGKKSLLDALAKKFYAPLDDLLLIQEKHTVTKDELESLDAFDKLFKYPAWLDFSDEANDYLFDQILHNKLSDEQIDYFLGAADDMRDYEKWFKVAKHVLNTTQDPHTFWVAGDILSIIWKAIPEDPKSQKWFKDELFNIFWPRVGSVWPILNKDKINFDTDASSRILSDAIGWLEDLDDLKDRLPELGDTYEPIKVETDAEVFARAESDLRDRINSSNAPLSEVMTSLFDLSELVFNEDDLKRFERLAREELIPAIDSCKDKIDPAETFSWIERSIAHAKDYVETLKRERERLVKYLIKA